MNTNLIEAMAEEKRYIEDKMSGRDSSLPDRLKAYGYGNLQDYFFEKKAYLFEQWKPEIYRISVDTFAQDVEDAIENERYGIYIPVADGLYAYHGTDEIDQELCNRLGVRVISLNYTGGTIIGSADDLSIEIIMPANIGITPMDIICKVHEIISRYIDGVTVSGNDILIDGEKVMGSMQRYVGRTFVWAAQISFGEYTDIIEQVCNKKSVKKPAFIDGAKLTKDALESEVVAWLRKY